MHLRYALRPLFLAICVTALFAVSGIPAGAESPSPVSGSAENKPRTQNILSDGGAQPEDASAANMEPVMLREITVTATRTEREVFDVPSSVTVIDKKAMEREPQPTIAEQLRDIPGVEVSDGGMGGGTKRVSIRGESPARVLVLIDGMKISEQKSMDGSMIMIDPLNVERIEVIKGPASVLYGSDAIGGVVNIITKKGGNEPAQGMVAFTGDTSNSSLTPYVSLYGTLSGFHYRLSGDYTDAGDKRGGSGRIEGSGYVQKNFSAYLDYAWDKGSVGMGYDRFWADISIPGVESGGAEITMHLPKWQRDRFYSFTELNSISDVLRKVRLTQFIQETQKDFWNDINVSAPPMHIWQHPFVKNKQTSYGGNLQTDWTLGEDHYVIAGFDYLYDDLDAKDDRQGRITRLPNTVLSYTHEIFHYGAYQQSVAVYAQDEWTLLKDWTATIGLRQTWLRSALDSTDDATVPEISSRDAHLVGSLGLVYAGFQNWRLRALYSQGYRYPLLNQLYIGTTHGSSGMLHPNPDLKPETSQNFEIGTRYNAGGMAADVSFHYNLARNYISARSVPGTSDTIYENVNRTTTYGAEFMLGYTHAPWNLTPYGSAAYMRRTFDRGENGGKTTNTGHPAWIGRVGLKYEREFSPFTTLYADVYGRFAAGAKEDLSDGTQARYAGWGTANLAVGIRLGEKQQYFLDINLNNLFNKSYIPATSSLEDPGFHLVLRTGMEF